MQSDNPTAAILLIGDELLSGRTRDSNAHHLAGVLNGIGIDLTDVFLVLENEGVQKFEESWSELLEETQKQLDSSAK